MKRDMAIGAWLPDLSSFSHTGLVEAKNLLPALDGYRPLGALVPTGDALPARAVGAFGMFDGQGNPHLFAGTAAGLFKRSAGSWGDVTRAAGAYTTGSEMRWRFAQYGNRLVAANGTNKLQSFLVGTDSQFADLAVDAPVAGVVAVINNFIVAGGLADAGNKVQWSGLDAPTSWAADPATQADSQLLENEGGAVQAIIGQQNYGVVLQEYAITRMEYVGAPEIFTFADVERRRGALTPGGVAASGQEVFFLSEDGFFRFDGVRAVPIGEGKINQWFFDQLDRNYLHNIHAAVDPVQALVWWSFPAHGSAGLCNRLVIYHMLADRWNYAEVESEVLLPLFGDSYTLEELDNVSSSLDALPYPLDSRKWQGKDRQMAMFDASHRLAIPEGAVLDATLVTADLMLHEGGSSLLRGVMPLVTGGSASLRAAARDVPTAAVAYGAAQAVGGYGQADLASHGRWHRLEISLSGAWGMVSGYRLDFAPIGRGA